MGSEAMIVRSSELSSAKTRLMNSSVQRSLEIAEQVYGPGGHALDSAANLLNAQAGSVEAGTPLSEAAVETLAKSSGLSLDQMRQLVAAGRLTVPEKGQ